MSGARDRGHERIEPRRDPCLERDDRLDRERVRDAHARVAGGERVERWPHPGAAVVTERRCPEGLAREQALAEVEAVLHLRDGVVRALVEEPREQEVGVEHLRLEPGGAGEALQQMDAERRAVEPRERRDDEQDVRRPQHGLEAGGHGVMPSCVMTRSSSYSGHSIAPDSRYGRSSASWSLHAALPRSRTTTSARLWSTA